MARFDRVIPPGGEGKVVLEIDTENLSGNISKGLLLGSNDPDWPELRFQLKATVKPLFLVKPESRSLIHINKGEPWSKDFTVKSVDGVPFKITKTKSSTKYFRVTHDSVNLDKKNEYEISIKASTDIPAGRISETVDIFTDTQENLSVKIQLFGKVEGNISIHPKRVSFYPDPENPKKTVSRNILITKEKGEPLKFKGINIPEKRMKYSVVEVEKGREYILVLIWPGTNSKRKITGNILLETNDIDMAEIKIPYQIFH